MPKILKKRSYLFQLTRRSMPTISNTAAIKMIGEAALDAANFLTTSANPVSSRTGAFFLELEREEELREDWLLVVFFEVPLVFLEELPDPDLREVAIISRCSLSL